MRALGRLWRAALVWVLGPPVCPGCEAHRVDCVGWCKQTDAERSRLYIEGRR